MGIILDKLSMTTIVSSIVTLFMSKKMAISSLSGFSHGIFPFIYLGIPLFQGKPKTIHLRLFLIRLKPSWELGKAI